QAQERVAATVHVLGERGVGHLAAAEPDGDLRAAALDEMLVDERYRHVEAWGERDRGRRSRSIQHDQRLGHGSRLRSARAANSRAACLRQLMEKSVFWSGLATWATSSAASRRTSSSVSLRPARNA